jgi:hypothetical protein
MMPAAYDTRVELTVGEWFGPVVAARLFNDSFDGCRPILRLALALPRRGSAGGTCLTTLRLESEQTGHIAISLPVIILGTPVSRDGVSGRRTTD